MSIQNLNSSRFVAGHTQCTAGGTCAGRGRLMVRGSQEKAARCGTRSAGALSEDAPPLKEWCATHMWCSSTNDAWSTALRRNTGG